MTHPPSSPGATTELLAQQLARRLTAASVTHTATEIAVRLEDPPCTALIQLGKYTCTITTLTPPAPRSRRAIGRGSHTPAQLAALLADTFPKPPRPLTAPPNPTPPKLPAPAEAPTPPRAASPSEPRPTRRSRFTSPRGLAATHPHIAAQLAEHARTTPTDPFDPTERPLKQPPLEPALRDRADTIRDLLISTGCPMTTGELSSRLQIDRRIPIRPDALNALRNATTGMFTAHHGKWALPGWTRIPNHRGQHAPAPRNDIKAATEPPQPHFLHPSQTPDPASYTWPGFVIDLTAAITTDLTTARPEVHVWDSHGRAVTHRFVIDVLIDTDIHWITSTHTVVGSHTTERLHNTNMWTPWPSYAPHTTVRTPANYFQHPDNPLIHTRVDAHPEHLARALAITIRDYLGVDDPARVTVPRDPRPHDEQHELQQEAKNLLLTFHPAPGTRNPCGGARGAHKTPRPILGTCVACNQDLTDPVSADRRMGPDCYKRVKANRHRLGINSHNLPMEDYLQRVARSRWPKDCWAAGMTLDTWRARALFGP